MKKINQKLIPLYSILYIKTKNGVMVFFHLPKHIANHLAGEDHTKSHRRISGGLVMVVGVGITYTAHHVFGGIIGFIGDLVGYGIHGIGLVPFVSEFEKKSKNENNDKI